MKMINYGTMKVINQGADNGIGVDPAKLPLVGAVIASQLGVCLVSLLPRSPDILVDLQIEVLFPAAVNSSLSVRFVIVTHTKAMISGKRVQYHFGVFVSCPEFCACTIVGQHLG